MASAKAIFFDRDGVLIEEDGDYTFALSKVKILPSVIAFMKEMSQLDYRFFVITNQGGAGKGMYGMKEINEVHSHINAELKKEGVAIESFLTCVHHPTTSNCICRKPDSLLLERAIALYQLNSKECFLIGDQDRDIQAAEKVGIKAIKVTSNSDLFRIIDQLKS